MLRIRIMAFTFFSILSGFRIRRKNLNFLRSFSHMHSSNQILIRFFILVQQHAFLLRIKINFLLSLLLLIFFWLHLTLIVTRFIWLVQSCFILVSFILMIIFLKIIGIISSIINRVDIHLHIIIRWLEIFVIFNWLWGFWSFFIYVLDT